MSCCNRKKCLFLLSLLILMFGLSSCCYKQMRQNRANLAKIRKGMTRKQVLQIMGEPIKNEIYCSPDVIYYYTRQVWMDGMTTRDECTPIAFDEHDRVIGWGNEYHTGIYSHKNIVIPISSKKQ